jgi:VWFA-related protein
MLKQFIGWSMVVLTSLFTLPLVPSAICFDVDQGAPLDENPQSPNPFTMRVDVDLTTIEFVARDKNGNPIPNLKIENFRLYENGKKQKILSFDEVKEESSQASSKAIIEDDRHHGKAVLILFVSGANVHEQDTLLNMLESAAGFVREHMRPHDMFALVSGTSIRVLQNFTTDREAMMAAIQNYSFKFGSGATFEDMLRTLERLCLSLSHLKGQKSILIYTSSDYGFDPATQMALANALDSAKKANVVFYTVDPSRTNLSSVDSSAPNRSAMPASTLSPLAGVNAFPIFSKLATGTGGYAIRAMGNINRELDSLGRQLSNYYILGFQSNNPNHDGRYRKIEIKTDVKGLSLRHRPGYQDRSPIDVLASSKQEKTLLNALASPGSANQLPIVFRPIYFFDNPKAARVIIPARIQAEKMTFKKDAGQMCANLNAMGAAYAEDGTIAARFSETLPLCIEKEKEAQFRQRGLSYRNYFILRPGKYRVKLAVSDESNNLGSMEQSMEVPLLPEQGLGAGSLVVAEQTSRLPDLIQHIQAQMLDQTDPLIFLGAQIEPSAENKISFNSGVFVLFRLYGLSGDPNQWNLTAKTKLLDKKGNATVLELISIKDSVLSLGKGVAAVGLSLPFANIDPGTYRLTVEVMEGISAEHTVLETDVEFYR